MTNARTVIMCVSVAFVFPVMVLPQGVALGQGMSTMMPAQAPGSTSDDRPLTGIREQGLGATRPRHSFIQPSASIFGTWDSNGNFQNAAENATSLVGNVSLVTYMGRGGTMAYDGTVRYDSRQVEYQDNLVHSQQLRWSQVFGGGPWSLLLSDEALLTPSSMGGLVGMGVMGMVSSEDLGIPVLNPSVVPDQSIVTDSSQRFTNAAAAEIDYRVSRRSSFTLSGSNGIFRSLDNNLMDGTQYYGSVGYNSALSERDTFALSCGYEMDHIGQMGVTIRSYSPGLNYEHRLAGRFLVQVSGYAQPYQLTTPSMQRNEFSWGGNAGIQYRLSKTTMQADVSRSLSLGSGLLAGSRVVMETFMLSRPISRRWEVDLDAVHARNSGLTGQGSYDTEYGGVRIERQLTRSGSIFVRYGLQHGLSNCTATGCGPMMLQNIVDAGFNWTRSPIGIF